MGYTIHAVSKNYSYGPMTFTSLHPMRAIKVDTQILIVDFLLSYEMVDQQFVLEMDFELKFDD